MKSLAVVAATVAAATSFAAPSASALPIPGWPLGVTCHYTQVLADAADGYVFSIEGGPLVPVTDTGEQVSDVEVSCFLEIVPATYPTVTMSGTSTRVAGVAYLPRMAQVVPTGDSYTRTLCSRLTWTDSTNTARTGGSCTTW